MSTEPGKTQSPTDIAVDTIVAENEKLKREMAEIAKQSVELAKSLKQANDFIGALQKQKLVEDLRRKTTLGVEYLSGMEVTDLKNLNDFADKVKPPTFKSSGDTGVRNASDVLYDLYEAPKWKR